MTEQVEKKGMSKGCLISLIVAGVIIVLAIIATVFFWMNRDDLARLTAKQVLESTKQALVENPVVSVDTVQYNSITDAFIMKMDSTEMDFEKYGQFFQKIQSIPADNIVDANEVIVLMDAMVEYFPELQQYLPQEEADTIEGDTTESEE